MLIMREAFFKLLKIKKSRRGGTPKRIRFNGHGHDYNILSMGKATPASPKRQYNFKAIFSGKMVDMHPVNTTYR